MAEGVPLILGTLWLNQIGEQTFWKNAKKQDDAFSFARRFFFHTRREEDTGATINLGQKKHPKTTVKDGQIE